MLLAASFTCRTAGADDSGTASPPANSAAAGALTEVEVTARHLDEARKRLTQTLAGSPLTLDALVGSFLRAGFINADHLPSCLELNLGAHRSFMIARIGLVNASLSVLNVLDRVYEIRDGTGVGVGAPQWGMRRSLYVGPGKSFGP